MKIESGSTASAYFYSRDHLGSIHELTDSAGSVRARYVYDPFGRRTRLTGDIDANFGFARMFWSPETNLNLTRFRAYDPGPGRWLSRDPLEAAETEEGINLFAYVRNNPVRWRDPTGHGVLDHLRDYVVPGFHQCRNIQNFCPKHPPNTCSNERNNGWLKDDYSFFTRIFLKEKWRSPHGYECDYDKDGNLLPDKDANYTYNYAPKSGSLKHILWDVLPHFLYLGGSTYKPNLTTITKCE